MIDIGRMDRLGLQQAGVEKFVRHKFVDVEAAKVLGACSSQAIVMHHNDKSIAALLSLKNPQSGSR